MSEFVYVIQCPASKLIKIGKTNSIDPYERINSIQTSNPFPLEILKIVVGADGLELKLHKQFSSFRFRGEWFKGDCLPDLMDTLKQYPVFKKGSKQIQKTPKNGLEKILNAKGIERHHWKLGNTYCFLHILKFKHNIWQVRCIDYRWGDSNFCCESEYRVSTVERLKKYLDQCPGCLYDHEIWIEGCLTSVFFNNIDDARAFVKVLKSLTKNDFIDTSLKPVIMPLFKEEAIEFNNEDLAKYKSNSFINFELARGDTAA